MGQKNKLTYRWARKGSRPRAIHDQRTQSTYLFGGMPRARSRRCPRAARLQHRGHAASTKSQRKSPSAHTPFSFSIKLDGTAPKTSRLPKTSRSCRCRRVRGAQPQENIWQFMRANWLSNRIFKSFGEIIDHCCYAWNTLIDQPWKIMSLARRDWESPVTHCEGWSYSSSLTRSDSRTRWNPGGGASPTASSTTASVFTNFFGRTRFARAQSISNASV